MPLESSFTYFLRSLGLFFVHNCQSTTEILLKVCKSRVELSSHVSPQRFRAEAVNICRQSSDSRVFLTRQTVLILCRLVLNDKYLYTTCGIIIWFFSFRV